MSLSQLFLVGLNWWLLGLKWWVVSVIARFGLVVVVWVLAGFHSGDRVWVWAMVVIGFEIGFGFLLSLPLQSFGFQFRW